MDQLYRVQDCHGELINENGIHNKQYYRFKGTNPINLINNLKGITHQFKVIGCYRNNEITVL